MLSDQTQKTILFAAGGTGGHVIPAYVLAKKIREEHPEYRCVFVGVKGKFEEKWIPQQGFEVELLEIGGFKSGPIFKRLAGLFKLPGAFMQSKRVLQKYNPDRIFGIGGYSSGPIMLLASLKGIPCAIIEPNAAPGFSNRVLSKFVKRVYVVFQQAVQSFPKEKVKNLGHLIRQEVFKVSPPNFKTSMKTITILCGSQGSMKINDVVCRMLEKNIDTLQNEITVIHQTGARDYENIQKRYQSINITNTVEPFFENMFEVYGRSHLIIGRSGSSVLEFAAVGIPCILIPLAIAADNHQYENAKELQATGGAVIIEEKNLTQEKLFEELMKFLHKDLSTPSHRLRVLRKENAVKDIMDDFLSIV